MYLSDFLGFAYMYIYTYLSYFRSMKHFGDFKISTATKKRGPEQFLSF